MPDCVYGGREWAKFNRELEQNQRAVAERRVKDRKITIQCSGWEMADTAGAFLPSKGFQVLYPGEDGCGAVAAVNKTAQEHVLIRNGNYFTAMPGPGPQPGYRTKVAVTVHGLTGGKLAEYQGESVPSYSFHRMEAARSLYWQGMPRILPPWGRKGALRSGSRPARAA